MKKILLLVLVLPLFILAGCTKKQATIYEQNVNENIKWIPEAKF